MTSKNSLGNIFWIKAKQNSYLFVLTFLGFLFTTTMPVFFGILNVNKTLEESKKLSRYTWVYSDYLECNVFHGVLAIGFAIFIAMMLYRYLHSKTEVDFYHSLPIKREMLFIGNYLIGIIYFVTCYIFHVLVSLLMFAVAGRWGVIELEVMMPQILATILAYIAVYSVTVFASMICGNLYVTAMVALGLMFVVPAYAMCIVGLGDQFLQYYAADSRFLEEIMAMTSPIINYFANSWYLDVEANGNVSYFLVILFYTLGGVYAYKKRASEQATNAMVFKSVRLVIKSLGTVLAFFLGGFLFSAIINTTQSPIAFIAGGIFVAFLVHAIFEVLFESDIRAWLQNIKHFVAYAVLGTIITLAFVLDVTGYNSKLPKREDIVSIEYENTVLTSEDNIDILYEHLEGVIQGEVSLEPEESYYLSTMYIALENGKTFQRQYGTDGRLSLDQVIALETSEEFITQSFKYDLDIETAFIEEDLMSNYYVKSNTGEDYFMSVSTARDVYRLILSDEQLLSPEYLAQNLPVSFLYGSFNDSLNTYMRYYEIPIYEVQTKALEYVTETLGVSFTSTVTPNRLSLSLPNSMSPIEEAETETYVSEGPIATELYYDEGEIVITDVEDIALLLDYMIPTDYNARYVGTGGNYSMDDKEVVGVYDASSEYYGYSLIGYIRLADYLGIEEQLNVG
ncbi:MAG: hypothetical protein R3Y47_02965 [Lachnospiraceae bacterium]